MTKENKQILLKFIFLLIIMIASYFSPTITKLIDEYTVEHGEKVEHREEAEHKNDVEQTIAMDEEKKFHIYFIDVGQADCMLIENNQNYMLIDAGNREDGNKLVAYFQSLGITQFQYVIGTHAHEDHIGGMAKIIQNFSVQHFYMPDVVTTTKTFEDVLDALQAKKISFETPSIDSTFTMADTKFTVLSIGKDKTDLNNTSIVLKSNYKNTSYLFMADAESLVEKNILGKDLKSDVLKVGHHGSQYSTSAAFLKAVNPKYAVIEVGKDNSYGHPKSVTLQKLKRLDVSIYRTDQDGTILLSSNGEEIVFDTIKTDTNG